MDWRTDATEVRRCRRLVVSFICTIANYEYGFYWYLYQTGSIESEGTHARGTAAQGASSTPTRSRCCCCCGHWHGTVKLTGVLSTGADPGPWGTKITKDGLYAPIHQVSTERSKWLWWWCCYGCGSFCTLF